MLQSPRGVENASGVGKVVHSLKLGSLIEQLQHRLIVRGQLKQVLCVRLECLEVLCNRLGCITIRKFQACCLFDFLLISEVLTKLCQFFPRWSGPVRVHSFFGCYSFLCDVQGTMLARLLVASTNRILLVGFGGQ
jgi:hypothetical protein